MSKTYGLVQVGEGKSCVGWGAAESGEIPHLEKRIGRPRGCWGLLCARLLTGQGVHCLNGGFDLVSLPQHFCLAHGHAQARRA